MKLKFLLIAALAILYLNCQSEKKEKAKNLPSIFEWLSEEEIIDIEITGDLNHLFTERNGEDHLHPAQIKLGKTDKKLDLDIEIARRGVTRKKICDFPPIKLKFPKKTLKSNGFSKHNDYKLVTHCMEEERELVLKEYLAYKLFNQLTDKSFNVQLAKIKYIDISGTIPENENYGFLIEGNKELAERLDGKLVNPEKTRITTVDKEQYKKMVVFQYMIGNTDWNIAKGHNIKWVQSKSLNAPTPVPYDFDYCGLVNAPYAIPHPQLPIKSVRERLLQWRGKSKDVLLPVCESIKAQKEEFLKICQAFDNLDDLTRKDMVSFLESFFEEVEERSFL